MELIYVYKKELNSKAKERMLAVLNVVEEGETISTITHMFYKSYNTVKNWVMRFKEFGVAGLYEKSRSGRPTKIVNHKITEFFVDIKNSIFPKQLAHIAICISFCTANFWTSSSIDHHIMCKSPPPAFRTASVYLQHIFFLHKFVDLD